MATATASHVDKPAVILLNGKIMAVVNVATEIRDQLVVNGVGLNSEEAAAIAEALNRQASRSI